MLLKLKINCKKIIFSGVCKSKKDLKYIIKKKIGFISIESYEELKRLIIMKTNIKIILKVNLNIKTNTIKEISTGEDKNKFGINKKDLEKIINLSNKEKIKIYCLGFHLGSQILDHKPYICAIKKIIKLTKKIKNINKNIINIGGGFGIDYYNGNKKIKFKSILKFLMLKKFIKVFIEPGRSLIADACKTISKIEYIKKNDKKKFIIINIGMESIIRPALYKSYHRVENLKKRKGKKKIYDIVGPICESTDVLYKNKKINARINDNIIIYDTGAYCMSMRMGYNMRKRPKEILVLKNKKIKNI